MSEVMYPVLRAGGFVVANMEIIDIRHFIDARVLRWEWNPRAINHIALSALFVPSSLCEYQEAREHLRRGYFKWGDVRHCLDAHFWPIRFRGPKFAGRLHVKAFDDISLSVVFGKNIAPTDDIEIGGWVGRRGCGISLWGMEWYRGRGETLEIERLKWMELRLGGGRIVGFAGRLFITEVTERVRQAEAASVGVYGPGDRVSVGAARPLAPC
jgi:hypothetical protein